jgi:hypothetical protein
MWALQTIYHFQCISWKIWINLHIVVATGCVCTGTWGEPCMLLSSQFHPILHFFTFLTTAEAVKQLLPHIIPIIFQSITNVADPRRSIQKRISHQITFEVGKFCIGWHRTEKLSAFSLFIKICRNSTGNFFWVFLHRFQENSNGTTSACALISSRLFPVKALF